MNTSLFEDKDRDELRNEFLGEGDGSELII